MTHRMLVVDDEETIRWALRELFMQDGWEVHCAEDGDQAARMVAERPYDYMITDLKMAGRSGVDVIREARRRSPRMGVTVLTGYASLETAVEALRLQAWDYVTKPCRAPDLKARVDAFFRGNGGRRAGRAAPSPLDDEALAAFLRGEGTEVLRFSPTGGDGNGGEAFSRLRGIFADLGLSHERAEALVQSCVEAAALLDAGRQGSGRAGLLNGHFLISVSGTCGGASGPSERLRRVSEQFGVDARLLAGGRRCSIVLSEAI